MSDTFAFEVCRVDSSEEQFNDDRYVDGHAKEPVIHCFGYDSNREWHHVKIRGFEPYCYVRYEQVDQARDAATVKRVELYDADSEEFESVRGIRQAKIITATRQDVRDLESDGSVGQTWESDVPLPDRFIADLSLGSGIRVPYTDDNVVHIETVTPVDISTDWRIHYTDIEVNDRNGFPEGGDEPILCITAYDSFEDKYIVWLWKHGADIAYPEPTEMHGSEVEMRYHDSEEMMLRTYFGFISATHPAVITGWNSNDFDIPYLIARAQELDLHYEAMSPIGQVRDHDYYGLKIGGMACIDLLDAYKATQFTDMESYRLDDIGEAVLGVSKETFVGKIGDLWETDPEQLVDYNIRDVELLVELDRDQSILPFWREVKRMGVCRLSDAIIESSVVNKYLLNVLQGDRALPRKGSEDNVSSSYSGGAVFDAYNGLAQNVAVFDLASLYPMSMLTINASPETKLEPPEGVPADEWEPDVDYFESPNGIKFRKDQVGITRQIIEDLYARRKEKKAERDEHDPDSNQYKVLDRQQTAIKVIMNSLYGVMAWNRFRLYDQDVAAAVTATGREVLDFTADVARDMGYEVLYGDTDSVLLKFPDHMSKADIIEAAKEVEARINERYADFASDDLNAVDDHRFEIEFEKLYRRYFQSGAKKRYAGHITHKEGKDVDDTDITGYEYKRSDTAPIASEVQKHVLEMITSDATPAEVARYVSEQLDRFDKRDLTLEEIGIPEGIGKSLDNYSSPTHAVRAAKSGNLLLGTSFNKGSKPKRYYLDDVDDAFFHRIETEQWDVQRDPLYLSWRDDPRLIGVTSAQQLPSEFVLDWDHMRYKTLKQSLSSITDALGLDWDELLEETDQTTLEAF